MQQRPFLSRYEFNLQNFTVNTDLTVRTKTIESSDDDEYYLEGTLTTETIESSDPDEYVIGSTSRKKLMGDDDEYYSFGTIHTRMTEDTDTDFFMLEEIK